MDSFENNKNNKNNKEKEKNNVESQKLEWRWSSPGSSPDGFPKREIRSSLSFGTASMKLSWILSCLVTGTSLR